MEKIIEGGGVTTVAFSVAGVIGATIQALAAAHLAATITIAASAT